MKRTILLKQITPMWHFQPDIKDCCLRATEVKPKLDKYLYKLYGNKLSQFRIGDTDAYDYKLSFRPKGEQKPLSFNTNNFRLYFGNMGEGPQKGLIYYVNSIEMSIFTLHKDLERAILDNLCSFFATHSFGTRQDKGFGFFFLQKYQSDITYTSFNEPHGADYKFSIDLTQAIDDENFSNSRNRQKKKKVLTDSDEDLYTLLFEHINYFHKLIRGGINEGKAYHKSFMYFYAKREGKEWDKPLIRHHFKKFNPIYRAICNMPHYKVSYSNGKAFIGRGDKTVELTPRREMEDEFKSFPRHDKDEAHNADNMLLFRDALGLSSEQLWLKYDKDVISIKTGNDNFTRFKSPILYRPSEVYTKEVKDNRTSKQHKFVDVFIYLDGSGLEELKKQRFEITHSQNDTVPHSWNEKEQKPISIGPIRNAQVYKGFDLDDYFNFIIGPSPDNPARRNYQVMFGDYKIYLKPDRYLNRIFHFTAKGGQNGLRKINPK